MTAESTSVPAASLRDRVMRGLGWVAASQLLMQLSRACVAVLLARLLTPEQFGVAAIVLVFASLVLVFSDLALGAALVQAKTLTEADRSTAFWTTVAAGFVFCILGLLLSGPIASLFGEPTVKPLCMALSGSFLITSVAVTHQSLLVREMEFRRLETQTMVSVLIGGAIGVGVALAGKGSWAIIAQQLGTAVAASILLWVLSPWRPRFVFSKESLRRMGGFSLPLVGHRLLFYVHRNADNVLVARFVGPAALGAYQLSYNLMLVPMSRIGGPLQRVFAPAFARMQDDPERIAETWARLTRMVASIAIPSLMGLVVVAPDFVSVVLGDEWVQVAPIVQLLAWVGMIQALQAINIDILQARNRTSTILRYSIGFCIAHVVGFAIGVQWGVIGVAAAYAVTSLLVEPVLTVLTARALAVSPWVFVRSVSGVFLCSLAMAAAVLAARLAMLDNGIPALVRLVVCVVVGVVTFALVCAWRVPEVRLEYAALVRRLLARRRRVVEVA
jgi:O-antigen/teichoic acid export membrane protein